MTSLYDNVIATTDRYLGPAADRFVARLVRYHLQKDPRQLQPEDLRPLIDWIQLALRMINKDGEAIDQYVAELRMLANSNVMLGTKNIGR